MNILYITKILLIVLIIVVLGYAFYRYMYTKNNNNNQPQPVTKENFAPVDGKLILYHASWCGHCQNFMPEWDKFAQYAKKNFKNVLVTKIQCDGDKQECKLDFIKGFPTVALHKKNGETVLFQDDRTMDKLIEFMNKHL